MQLTTFARPQLERSTLSLEFPNSSHDSNLHQPVERLREKILPTLARPTSFRHLCPLLNSKPRTPLQFSNAHPSPHHRLPLALGGPVCPRWPYRPRPDQ